MKPTFIGILLLLAFPVMAQIPRNEQGLFEYAHTITLTEQAQPLADKARAFFRQPFLVHWDSVQVQPLDGGVLVQGKGYIRVRIYYRMRYHYVPVTLDFELITRDSSYQYTIHHLVARHQARAWVFPLEERPAKVKAVVYDKLIDRTHRYLSRVIGYMKQLLDEKDGG